MGSLNPPILAIAICNSGRYMVAATGAPDTSMYYISQDKRLIWRAPIRGMVKSVSISGSGNSVLTGIASGRGMGNVIYYDRKGETIWSKSVYKKVTDCTLSRRGDRAAAATDDGQVSMFSKNGTLIWQNRPRNVAEKIVGLDFLEDELFVAYRRGHCFFLGMDGSIKRKLELGGIYDNICIAPKTGVIIGATGDKYVTYSDADGKLVWRTPLNAIIEDISCTAMGDIVCAGTKSNTFVAISGQGQALWSYEPDQPITGAALSLMGDHISLSTRNGLLFHFNKGGQMQWNVSCDPNATPEGFGEEERELKRVREKIASIDAMIESARSSGVNVSRTATILDRAKESLEDMDFDLAQDSLNLVVNSLNSAKKKHEETRHIREGLMGKLTEHENDLTRMSRAGIASKELMVELKRLRTNISQKEPGIIEKELVKFATRIGRFKEEVVTIKKRQMQVEEKLRSAGHEIMGMLSTSDVTKKLGDALSGGKLETCKRLLSSVEEELPKVMESAEPDLSVGLDEGASFQAHTWNEVTLLVKNAGKAAAKNVRIAVAGPSETRPLDGASDVPASSEKKVDFLMKFDQGGSIPVRMVTTAERFDGKMYQSVSEHVVTVEGGAAPAPAVETPAAPEPDPEPSYGIADIQNQTTPPTDLGQPAETPTTPEPEEPQEPVPEQPVSEEVVEEEEEETEFTSSFDVEEDEEDTTAPEVETVPEPTPPEAPDEFAGAEGSVTAAPAPVTEAPAPDGPPADTAPKVMKRPGPMKKVMKPMAPESGPAPPPVVAPAPEVAPAPPVAPAPGPKVMKKPMVKKPTAQATPPPPPAPGPKKFAPVAPSPPAKVAPPPPAPGAPGPKKVMKKVPAQGPSPKAPSVAPAAPPPPPPAAPGPKPMKMQKPLKKRPIKK